MNKAAQLERLLGERIVILDGAMGTMIQGTSWPRRTFAASASPLSRAT